MTETLQLRGTLQGHNGWVTQIATNPKYPDTILSSSRGNFYKISILRLGMDTKSIHILPTNHQTSKHFNKISSSNLFKSI